MKIVSIQTWRKVSRSFFVLSPFFRAFLPPLTFYEQKTDITRVTPLKSVSKPSFIHFFLLYLQNLLRGEVLSPRSQTSRDFIVFFFLPNTKQSGQIRHTDIFKNQGQIKPDSQVFLLLLVLFFFPECQLFSLSFNTDQIISSTSKFHIK